MKKKIKIGIDINEVLRAKWLQFDRYYVQEFGVDGVPEQPYCYDFFNNYKFIESTEIIKELKEPDDIPDTINPIDYQVNDNNESNADFLLFKKPEVLTYKPIEVYNKFMYEDFVFEIHGSAPMMYRNMDVDVNKLMNKYKNNVEFILFSVENTSSIPATLFFLSKIGCRFTNIKFVKKSIDMWSDVDVLITTDPILIKLGSPWGKKLIKVDRPYNQNIKFKGINILQLNDLNSNVNFEKIIKYKNE